LNSMPTHLTTTTVCEPFFKPVLNLLPDCSTTRVCPALPDSDWLQLCLARVLHECPSGRAFLQEYGGRFPQCPEVGAFFESFKSQRRERLVQELTLPPGLIAHLYRLRWNIEKVFDELKNVPVHRLTGAVGENRPRGLM